MTSQAEIDAKKTRNRTHRVLTEEQREEMRMMYATTDATITELAGRYKVAYGTAQRVLAGK